MEENEVKSRELIGNVEIKSFMFSEGLTRDFIRSITLQGATVDVEPIFNNNIRVGSRIKVYGEKY